MGRLMARLGDLDHRAMNARWGLLVAPFAWLAYRAGKRYRGRHGRAPLLLPGPGAALFHKGSTEGEDLPPRKRKA